MILPNKLEIKTKLSPNLDYTNISLIQKSSDFESNWQDDRKLFQTKINILNSHNAEAYDNLKKSQNDESDQSSCRTPNLLEQKEIYVFS